jgi:hypothetical protein
MAFGDRRRDDIGDYFVDPQEAQAVKILFETKTSKTGKESATVIIRARVAEAEDLQAATNGLMKKLVDPDPKKTTEASEEIFRRLGEMGYRMDRDRVKKTGRVVELSKRLFPAVEDSPGVQARAKRRAR